METDKVLRYYSQIESVTSTEVSYSSIFDSSHCDYCDRRNQYPDDCMSNGALPVGISCVLLNVYKHFKKLNINWLTISLVYLSDDEKYKIKNYNFSEKIEKMEEFSRYFNDKKNFSLNRELFVNKENSKLFFETGELFFDSFLFETSFDKESINVLSIDHKKEKKIYFNSNEVEIYKKKMAIFAGIKELNYLYFIAYKDKFLQSELKDFSGVYIPSDKKIDEKKISKLSKLVQLYLSPIENRRRFFRIRKEEQRKRNFALKSAISAIMSRNMSHQRGSHLLPGMTDRIDEFEDDVLRMIEKEKKNGQAA